MHNLIGGLLLRVSAPLCVFLCKWLDPGEIENVAFAPIKSGNFTSLTAFHVRPISLIDLAASSGGAAVRSSYRQRSSAMRSVFLSLMHT